MRKGTSKDAVEFVLYQPSTAGQGACSQEQYLCPPPPPPHETPLEKNPFHLQVAICWRQLLGQGMRTCFHFSFRLKDFIWYRPIAGPVLATRLSDVPRISKPRSSKWHHPKLRTHFSLVSLKKYQQTSCKLINEWLNPVFLWNVLYKQ